MPTTLPYITDDVASADLKAQFAEIEKIMGNVPPMLRILATVPATVTAFMDFAGPVLMGPNLSIDLKALALLRTSELNDCNYCRGYYAGLAEQVGLVGDKRAALNKPLPPASMFNEKEQVLLELATQMTREIQADPKLVARAREVLGIGGTVEAMLIVGLFNLINRFARTAGLPLQD
jgi:alkylhydroperoxidase family enzyme